MSDAEVEEKFAALVDPCMPRGKRESLLRALWELERAPAIAEVLDRVEVER